MLVEDAAACDMTEFNNFWTDEQRRNNARNRQAISAGFLGGGLGHNDYTGLAGNRAWDHRGGSLAPRSPSIFEGPTWGMGSFSRHEWTEIAIAIRRVYGIQVNQDSGRQTVIFTCEDIAIMLGNSLRDYSAIRL
jgi:hypothetical protein